jgi:hypothetical protein
MNSQTVSAKEEEFHYAAYENERLDIFLYPGYPAFVTFQPWETGRWRIKVYHTSIMSGRDTGSVTYFWKDVSDPYDEYHHWQTEAFGFTPWLASYEILNSGEASIGYQFMIKQIPWNQFPMGVTVLIEPW